MWPRLTLKGQSGWSQREITARHVAPSGDAKEEMLSSGGFKGIPACEGEPWLKIKILFRFNS